MQVNEVQSETTTDLKISHKFWIASSNFFETSLIFFPIFNEESLKSSNNVAQKFAASAQIYDCDGRQVNNVSCSFDANQVSVLEMASFIEGFKYEAGIKHGLIELKATSNIGVQCRLHSHSNATVLGNLIEVSKFQKSFLPLRLGESTNTLIVVANLSKDTNSIKGKLFMGKRSPEVNIELAPASVRILSLATEFADCIENKAYPSLGYLRATSRNDLPFAIQIIESVDGNKDETVFSSIL